MEGSEIRWGLVWAEADRRHQLHPLFLPHFYCTYNMKYELMNMNMIPDNKTSLNYTFLFSMSQPHQSLLIPWHRGELSSYCNIGHSPPNDLSHLAISILVNSNQRSYVINRKISTKKGGTRQDHSYICFSVRLLIIYA